MAFLVALDLPCSHPDVLRLAALLAGATGDAPLVVHVSRDPPTLVQLAELYTLAAPLREHGAMVQVRTVEGDAADGICRCAAEAPFRWVLLGAGRIRRAGGCSALARAVMRRCPLPVAAVRPVRCDPPPDPVRDVILASNGEPTGGAPRAIGGLLAEATGGSLLEVPEGTLRAREHRGRRGRATGGVVVVPVDPDRALPAWTRDLMRWEPGTVVVVSRRPLPGDVCYPTASG